MLIGHAAQQALFLEALASGRLHHAWLLAGPRGIGKRRFADWAALTLLGGGDPLKAAAAQYLLDAGSHPDHRILAPIDDGKKVTATQTILVDQVREMAEFLHSFPAIAGWRTLIVDSIDDMNPNASNAFLKELEEPRQKTVYLLVSHAPARLLPTIRSRCRTLRMFPLSESEAVAAIAGLLPDLKPDELNRLAQLSAGCPGAVAALQGADVAGLDAELTRIAAGGDPAPLARSVQGAAGAGRIAALVALVPRRLAEAARAGPQLALLELQAEAEALARDAVRLAYERGQVAMALADIMARAGRIQGSGRRQ